MRVADDDKSRGVNFLKPLWIYDFGVTARTMIIIRRRSPIFRAGRSTCAAYHGEIARNIFAVRFLVRRSLPVRFRAIVRREYRSYRALFLLWKNSRSGRTPRGSVFVVTRRHYPRRSTQYARDRTTYKQRHRSQRFSFRRRSYAKAVDLWTNEIKTGTRPPVVPGAANKRDNIVL